MVSSPCTGTANHSMSAKKKEKLTHPFVKLSVSIWAWALGALLLFTPVPIFGMVGCSAPSAGPDTCPGGTAAECTGSVDAGPYCVNQFGTDSCGTCTAYGSDQAQCTDVVRNGGNCSWDGTCCQDGSAPAPELPPGAFWYFLVAASGLAVLVSNRKTSGSTTH